MDDLKEMLKDWRVWAFCLAYGAFAFLVMWAALSLAFQT